MYSLGHVQCSRCYFVLGMDTDVLCCNQCHLWQHRKCSEDVPENFYQKCYIASVLGERPMSWTCQNCTGDQKQIIQDPQLANLAPTATLETVSEGGLSVSLILPPNPPPSLSSDGYDSDDSSFDELQFMYGIRHTEREGPGPCLVTSEDSATRLSGDRMVIINSQAILSDADRNPTLYTLYQTSSGDMYVTDSLGNNFNRAEEQLDETTMYQCANHDCHFKVRVCEVIQEFLCAGSLGAELHNHVSTNAVTTPNDKEASYHDNTSICSDSEETSLIIPEITSTPFHTPASRRIMSSRLTNGGCSNATEDIDLKPALVSTNVHKTRAFVHPISRLSLDISFSSMSDDSDDIGISGICTRLDELDDSEGVAMEIDCIPTSPASTIPAIDSSWLSEDLEISQPPSCELDQSPPCHFTAHRTSQTTRGPACRNRVISHDIIHSQSKSPTPRDTTQRDIDVVNISTDSDCIVLSPASTIPVIER